MLSVTSFLVASVIVLTRLCADKDSPNLRSVFFTHQR